MRLCCFLLAATMIVCGDAHAADWPAWRYGANRGGAKRQGIPDTLRLLWARSYPPPEPAWPDDPRLGFDRCYHPVVMGKTLFFGSSADDSVRAVDTGTGAERWRFRADGPIRFAPVAWEGKIYACSDDGYLYCLNSSDGTLIWKRRGGPSDRRVIGNGRIVSAWPARGAPVVAGGKVYFGAGIWPFMGIFLYALDAETGTTIWANDHTGAMYTMRPHGSPAFSGLAPQGYLAVSGERLLVPNGRNAVACLDSNTGRLIYHRAQGGGTYAVAAAQDAYFSRGTAFGIDTGGTLGFRTGSFVAIDGNDIYTAMGGEIFAVAISTAGETGRFSQLKTEERWRIAAPHQVSALIKAGNRLYAGGAGCVTCIRLPDKGVDARIVSRTEVKGVVADLIAADGKLFAVTAQGDICCFGSGLQGQSAGHRPAEHVSAGDAVPVSGPIAEMLKIVPGKGYCAVLGLKDGRLVEAIVRGSDLDVAAVGRNADEVAAIRKMFDDRGLYGRRVTVLQADPAEVGLPLHFAVLVTTEDPAETGLDTDARPFAQKALELLRPYGGVLCVEKDAAGNGRFTGINLPELAPTESVSGKLEMMIRKGPIPGTADWTHQYADAANTAVALDDMVKAPLGLLWFGGPSNREVLSRHGHGPSPQVVAGRLYIEGPDMLRAVDVYTGRKIWQEELPGIGAKYENENHQPGADATGANYVSLPDGIYAAYGERCLRLDPATGRRMSSFMLPRSAGRRETPEWCFLTVYEDLLIGGAGWPVINRYLEEQGPGSDLLGRAFGSSSRRLVALDRHTGELRWQITARHGFIHNSIVAGGGKIFCIDISRSMLLPSAAGKADMDNSSGRSGRLLAVAASDGKEIWSRDKDVFGTWLGYSEKRGVILQAGRASRDMLRDEPDSRMIAHNADDGRIVWDRKWEAGERYLGPCMLHGDTVITQYGRYHLMTGKPVTRRNPLTGAEEEWTYTRNYGCGAPRAGRHILTFRSAAAGYYDLEHDGGTGNFGGFRSGCSANLIPANGVLNAPEYTRGCTCGYPNQTSLAMIHMPENEMWTFNRIEWDGTRIERMGINFGAPGDRRSEDGTLWLEFPYVGGPSPDIPIRISPAVIPEERPQDTPGRFVMHSSRVSGPLPWVAASGLQGARKIVIPLAGPRNSETGGPAHSAGRANGIERTYTVELYFCEPDGLGPGARVFDVRLQGRPAIAGFDAAEEGAVNSAGTGRSVASIVRAVPNVSASQDLTVEFVPAKFSVAEPLICGIKVVASGR